MAEYRIYGKPNCNLFSLLGKGELAQSESLGLVLSQSEFALRAFIRLLKNVARNKKKLSHIRTSKYINTTYQIMVDCEFKECLNENNDYRADVIIRLYDLNKCPKYAILIEAKRKGVNISEKGAVQQIKKYWETFEELKVFKEKDLVSLVTITDVKNMFEDSEESTISLTWCELISVFENIEDSIVQDYINYLIKIDGNMKQYDKEILSIPAAESYENIIKSHIYCCPAKEKGPYKTRAEGHPLYIACRQKESKMTELLKIKEVLQIERPVVDADLRRYLTRTYGQVFIDNLDKYWTPSEREFSNVFIFDPNQTIRLPKPIKLRNGNSYNLELTFKKVFEETCGEYVII